MDKNTLANVPAKPGSANPVPNTKVVAAAAQATTAMVTTPTTVSADPANQLTGDASGNGFVGANPVAVVTSAEAAALSLTPAQRTAIIRLTSGDTRSEAAIAAGVTRTTLYRWLNHDPAFQAAFNAWHKDLVTTAQGQLLAASQEAIHTVLTAIRRGNAQLAWKLLESQGLTKIPKPGSTDVAHLQRQAELDVKRVEIAQRKEINDVLMDDMMTMEPTSSPL